MGDAKLRFFEAANRFMGVTWFFPFFFPFRIWVENTKKDHNYWFCRFLSPPKSFFWKSLVGWTQLWSFNFLDRPRGSYRTYLDMMIFSFGRIFEFGLSRMQVELIDPLMLAVKKEHVDGHYRHLVPHYSTKQFSFGDDQSNFYTDCCWYRWRNKFAHRTNYSH